MLAIEPNAAQVNIHHTLTEVIQSLATSSSQTGIHLSGERRAADQFLSYPQLYRRIRAAMAFFQGQGIKAGMRILFPFETTEETILSFFAFVGLGALPFSVKPHGLGSPLESYRQFLMEVSTRYGVDVLLDTPTVQRLEIPIARLSLPTISEACSDWPPFAEVSDQDIAFIQFSSGSTKFPKGIPVTHGLIARQVQFIARHAAPQLQDISSSWLPLYHDMGLVGAFLTPIAQHQTLFLRTPMQFLMDPMGWLQHLSTARITISVIPDFAISYCLRRLQSCDRSELEGLDLSALRLIFNGSEPIHADHLKAFEQCLAPYGLQPTVIKPCYGMAEAVLMVTCTDLDQPNHCITLANGCRAVSVGKPLPEYEIQLRTEGGQLCQEDELGEIELRGGTLVQEYFEDARPFYNADGFYATGDLGILRQGQLYVVGRAGDRFKVNGQSYFASDFEYAVADLPPAAPGKVAAFPSDNTSDNKIVLLIETKPFQSLEQGEAYQRQVAEHIFQQIGIKILPEWVQLIRPGQIQKTSSGKIKRRAIQDAYEAGLIQFASLGKNPG
ncbi:MAG: AMP-binding protein [Thermosynechococcaceae cyanobacterium MS004]|nr:AMP-binding protein [Thermosynechococcaceae cyanobacterium MS004]